MLREAWRAAVFGLPLRFLSDYPIETAVKRLRDDTERSAFTRATTGVGRVSVERVHLQWVVPMFGNAFKPIFVGRFAKEHGNVVLRGKFTMFLTSRVCMMFWFCGVITWVVLVAGKLAHACMSKNGCIGEPKLIWFLLFGLAMLVAGVFFVAYLWNYSRKDMDNLSDLIVDALSKREIDEDSQQASPLKPPLSTPVSDPVAQADLRKHLVANETLLWAARPRQGMFFRTSDAFSIPFGVAFILFILYWIHLSQTQDAPQIFLLMGALALLFGVYFLLVRFWVDVAIRRRRCYAITDKRVLIVRSTRAGRVSSIPIRNLDELSWTGEPTGYGTVFLRRPLPPERWFAGIPSPWSTPAIADINNPGRVYTLLCDLKE